MTRMIRFIALLALALPLQTIASDTKTDSSAPKSGFRAEFLRDLDAVQRKIVDLAATVPADKYSWRPAPGVRSISEVYMHIAGGNYLLASFTGMKPPGYDTRSLEKITDKDRVLVELRKSFDHLRTAALNATDTDLDKSIKMFGNDTTERAAFLAALNHLHEHLGQSIAYARMNGVVPPWSGKE
ncbi:MAG: damage-inducible protein DinB [Acidobacteria bacterium]|nr:MAG: damage-inducible protein DinB [Acidobacteriota bacterium]